MTAKNKARVMRRGITAFLIKQPRGRVRIVLDDVRESSTGWRVTTFYTWRDLRERDLKDMEIPERELANLGLAVVARLRATWEQSGSIANRGHRTTTRNLALATGAAAPRKRRLSPTRTARR